MSYRTADADVLESNGTERKQKPGAQGAAREAVGPVSFGRRTFSSCDSLPTHKLDFLWHRFSGHLGPFTDNRPELARTEIRVSGP